MSELLEAIGRVGDSVAAYSHIHESSTLVFGSNDSIKIGDLRLILDAAKLASLPPTDELVERVADAIEPKLDTVPLIEAAPSVVRRLRAEKIARAAISVVLGG